MIIKEQAKKLLSKLLQFWLSQQKTVKEALAQTIAGGNLGSSWINHRKMENSPTPIQNSAFVYVNSQSNYKTRRAVITQQRQTRISLRLVGSVIAWVGDVGGKREVG